ncbi:MAG: molybdopterin molybdotransferase MoeA [Planctomycetota bacterium]|jgi:molybdopterin molybdotransferase
MCTEYDIGFEEALSKTIDQLTPLAPVCLPVDEVGGLVAAENCIAKTDCPSVSTSLKDGYAVVATDLKDASQDRPVKLRICGTSVAGGSTKMKVTSGATAKIMTGARIPDGADAVIANEFTREENGWVLCCRDSDPGRNILVQGFDVTKGIPLASRGEVLAPAKTGLLAAGGISALRVHPQPRIGIMATGDELVSPSKPLRPGQLYASNLVTLRSWLSHFHMQVEAAVVGDQKQNLFRTAESMLESVDVLITSGGAWKSDRDLTIKVLEDMGGSIIFHRVRMGPGKAVALILLNDKTVFCLPGGPPSNEMAFLQVVLPGLFQLAGRIPVPFEDRKATLAKKVGGQKNWTQFFYAMAEQRFGELFVRPLEIESRLQCQANANALIKVPEGVERLEAQKQIHVQILDIIPILSHP